MFIGSDYSNMDDGYGVNSFLPGHSHAQKIHTNHMRSMGLIEQAAPVISYLGWAVKN